MIRISQRSKLALSVIAASIALPSVAQAAFVEDSTARLELRNMYMNRDFRNFGTVNRETQDEWGQGFTLRFESGFTEGTVGLGVDAMGQLGVKLDSAKGRTGTGVLAFDRSGEPEDEYSELGVTAKARISKTVLKLGTLQPTLPVAAYNDTRMLSSTYAGGLLTSQDIDKLTLNAGRLTEENARNDSSNNDISYGGVASSHLDLVGGTYAFNPQLSLSYYYAEMEHIYDQHFAGLVHSLPLGTGVSLRTDLRYFDTSANGDEKFRSVARVNDGEIDNRFFNGMVTLGVGSHKFGVGYQNLSGDGDFAFPGLDPYSVNLVTINIFTKAETDAWQLRYDYDFAALGVPGLSFMTRYVSADNVETRRTTDGTEWERDTDLVYTFQDTAFKGLNLRLRNASFRNGGNLAEGDIDEWRFIANYTIPLL